MRDVIIVEQKKMKTAKAMLWIGMILTVIAILAIIFYPGSMICKGVMLIGIVLAFVGSFQISGFYRCPKCGESVLSTGFFGALKIDLYSHCPKCGAKVEVEIRE